MERVPIQTIIKLFIENKNEYYKLSAGDILERYDVMCDSRREDEPFDYVRGLTGSTVCRSSFTSFYRKSKYTKKGNKLICKN